MNSERESDPLSALLGSESLPPNDPVRREAIFALTRGVLWRRRWLRRGAWATAFAACYAMGVLSGRSLSTNPNTQVVRQSGLEEGMTVVLPHDGQPNDAATLEPTRSDSQWEPKTAHAPVSSSPATTFDKLRCAGDRQLNERGNLNAAIGCYRRALDCAKDDDLQIVPERDSWLLISLKEARLEARKHVHKKS